MNAGKYIETEEKELDEIIREIETTNNYLASDKGDNAYHIEMLETLGKRLHAMRQTLAISMPMEVYTEEDREAFNELSTKLNRAEENLEGVLEEAIANTENTRNKPDVKNDVKAPPTTRGQMKAIGGAIGSALLVLLGLGAAATVIGLPIAMPLLYFGAKFFNKSANNYRKEKAIASVSYSLDQTTNNFESVKLTQGDNKRESWKKPAASGGRAYKAHADLDEGRTAAPIKQRSF